MEHRTRNTAVIVAKLISVSFVLAASLALLSERAIAQDQSSTSQNPCECWIDVKTGKQVPTVPSSGANYVKDPENAGLSSVALLSGDGKTARNSKTGQNYAKEPDGCWIDVKTGKRVPTA